MTLGDRQRQDGSWQVLAPGYGPNESNPLGTVALGLGILALLAAIAFPLVGALVAPWWAPPLLGVTALTVGIRGMRDRGAGRRRAVAGAIMGGIAVGLTAALVALVLAIGAAGGL